MHVDKVGFYWSTFFASASQPKLNCSLNVKISEAEYANVLQKKFLPVLMQSRYRPDGWLGLLLSSTYYFDLTKPMPGYEEKIQELLNGLRRAVGTFKNNRYNEINGYNMYLRPTGLSLKRGCIPPKYREG